LLGEMPIQQPIKTISVPDLATPAEPAEPKPDVVRPPTPQETPEKDVPIGVPDPLRDLPPPGPPQEIPWDRPPEAPPSRVGLA
jgi:hypothetical protein